MKYSINDYPPIELVNILCLLLLKTAAPTVEKICLSVWYGNSKSMAVCLQMEQHRGVITCF